LLTCGALAPHLGALTQPNLHRQTIL